MSDAWFGLLGVVVGGVISTLWAWSSAVRQELSDAMVAARLIDEDLKRFEEQGPERRPEPVDQDLWNAHRVALAKALGEYQWREVASAYRHATTRHEHVPPARAALAPLVKGKRFVVSQRRRNLLARPRGDQ